MEIFCVSKDCSGATKSSPLSSGRYEVQATRPPAAYLQFTIHHLTNHHKPRATSDEKFLAFSDNSDYNMPDR